MTEDDARAWVEKNKEELIRNLNECEEIPQFMKAPGDRFEAVWCAGCWLNEKLAEAGATEKEVHDVGFAHGQRSLFGNTFKWAVAYLNEFVENREIKDKPGEALADKINRTHIQSGDGFVAIAVEGND